MNPNAQFERDLEQWLQTEAPASAPAGFHATVMDRARTLRQRPGWATTLPARRLGRSRGITLLAAAALLLLGGAFAAGAAYLRLPTVVPPVPAPSVVAVVTTSPDATFPGPSESAEPSASPVSVAGPGGVWIPTGSMTTLRGGNSAVRLLDGRVLVVGGSVGATDSTSAELYDPVTGTWSATGNMLKPQGGFWPTLLLDGKVLVGHVDEPATDPAVSTIGAEVYDPELGTWTATGKMVKGEDSWAGNGGIATLLGDGKVLVTGQSGAQVYDPDGQTWSATGTMITPRHSHTATLLRDGRVLAVGGYDGGDFPLGSAELYDPDAGSWTAIASTHFELPPPPCPGCGGGYGWATRLQDGTVLMIRPSSYVGAQLEFGAEIYDPATGAWTELAGPPDGGGRATMLSDGTVLMTDLTGGDPDGEPPPCTAATLYDPRTGASTIASSMRLCRLGASFTLLLDGTVLVAGGTDCNDEGVCVENGTAELYVPAGVSPPPFSFPTPPPIDFPSPAPTTTPLPPLPPAVGPVPPNARSWTVTVDNESSEPARLFVAEPDEDGLGLVGSATPNVVPAGATVKVTFLFPADSIPDDGWIFVNPRQGDEGGLVGAADIGIPGKILIGDEGDAGWLSP